MNDIQKIIYNRIELAQSLGLAYNDVDALEAMTDPIPFFTLDRVGHLYPVRAVEAWSMRQCDREREQQ